MTIFSLITIIRCFVLLPKKKSNILSKNLVEDKICQALKRKLLLICLIFKFFIKLILKLFFYPKRKKKNYPLFS